MHKCYNILLQVLFFLLCILPVQSIEAQCGYDFPNGQTTITLDNNDCSPVLSPTVGPGEMITICNLEVDRTYVLSFCNFGGSSNIFFDSFFTLYTQGGGSVIAINDDFCGFLGGSQITFTYTGPEDGCVDLVIDQLSCLNFEILAEGQLAIACEINDCIEAVFICNESGILTAPAGPGIDDFANPNNDEGCLTGGENQSFWYYFEFDQTTPPNSTLEFSITPTGGTNQDYNFAVYGPDVDCDNLGNPIRCSTAGPFCNYCPGTGLGNGETDTNEGIPGDGFLAPLIVQPGQGYYLILDNFFANDVSAALTWGGTAAPFLNCDPDQECNLDATINPVSDLCPETFTTLFTNVSGGNGGVTYAWTAAPSSALAYLNNTTILNPVVTIPEDASGSIIYTITASEGSCSASDAVTLNILPPPIANPITFGQCDDGTGTAVFNLTEIESAVGNGETVTWYADINTTPPPISNITNYTSSGEVIYAVVTSNTTGCTAGPVPLTLTVFGTDCDDGCQYTIDTVDEFCDCVNTPDPPNCDDNDCSTDDSYDADNCICINTPLTPPNCDDGDCTTTDTYNTSTCLCENTPDAPPNCDDACPLTLDSYNASTCLCENTPPNPDDGCPLTTDTFDAVNCQIVNTPSDCDDECSLTIDSFDTANCQCTNTPPNPDDGCPLTTDTYDAANCQIINTPPDCDDGCPLTTDTFDETNCQCSNIPPDPDDACPLTTDSYDAANCQIINIPPDLDDGCPQTADSWDAINCQIINTPPSCDDACPLTIDIFDFNNCQCINTSPDPDDGCPLTTDIYDNINCQIINTPPDPDDGCPLTADNWDAANCQILNIPPNCNDGCAFTGDSFNFNTCQCENVLVTPDCDDNNCATTDSYDEPGCQCLNTPIPPPVAANAGLELCEEFNDQAVFDLTSLNSIVNNGTGNTVEWFDANGNLIGDPANYVSPTAFITALVFDNQNPSCQSTTAFVTLNVILTPEVGNGDVSAIYCNNDNSAVNLLSLLNGGPGGNWIDISSNPPAPGTFNAAGGTFIPAGNPAGVYVFEYVIPGNGLCPGGSATVTLNIEEEPLVTFAEYNLTVCNNANEGSTLDFQANLIGEDTNGNWLDFSNSGIDLSNPAQVDFDGLTPGSYVYAYQTASAVFPCFDPIVALSVIVEDCGCPSVATQAIDGICVGQTSDLSDYILTTESGTWSVTSTPIGSSPALLNGNSFVAANADAGEYELTFTLDAEPGGNCPDNSVQTITVSPLPQLDTPSDTIVCDNFILPEISGTNLSGNEAYFTGVNGTGAQYQAGESINLSTQLFIFDDNGNCSGETSFNLIIIASPDINNPGSQQSCDSFILPEISGANLSGDEAYYEQPGGTGTSYSAGDEINASTTLYIFDANEDCTNEVSFDITITSFPQIDNPGDQSACETFTLAEITGTDISADIAYFDQTGGNGNNYIAGEQISNSVTLFIFDANSDCEAEVSFNINIDTPPDAGIPEEVSSICNDSSTPVILENLLDGEDPAGTWAEVSAVPSASGAFSPAAGIFNPFGQSPGLYEFTYTLSGGNNCSDAVTAVAVDIVAPPAAQFSSTVTNTCNVTDQGSIVDLTALLSGGDINGIWTNSDGSPLTNPDAVDFTGLTEGGYFYSYITNSAVVPCNEQEYIIEVVVEDCSCPSVASAPPSAALCNNNESLDLTTLSLTDEPGNWSITNTPGGSNPAVLNGNTFSAANADAGEYEVTFTLAIAPTEGCPESSSQTITVQELPLIDNPGTLTACEEIALPLITGTNITSANYYSAANGGGISYNPGDIINQAGTYFILAQNGVCIEEISFEIILNTNPQAGAPGDTPVLCSTDNTDINLADMLEGEDAGGQWTETSTIASTGAAFNAAAGTFNPQGQAAGDFEFAYTVQGEAPCAEVSSVVIVSVISPPSTEFFATTINVCNVSDQGSLADLTALIAAGDSGGIWTDPLNQVLDNPNALDFDGVMPGSYSYTYTTAGAIAPCAENSYPIEIVVEDCSCPSVAIAAPQDLCNDSGSIDLGSLQITPEAGTWSISSVPAGSTPVSLNGSIFDAINADAGSYEITFALDNTPPPGCPAANAQTIQVNGAPSAGMGNSIEICTDELNAVNLSDLLTANDPNGTWSLNSGSEVPTADAFDNATGSFSAFEQNPGTYIFDYTISGQVPCSDASASVSVIVDSCECPSVSLNTPQPLCNDNGVLDLASLQITAEAGTWTITAVPTGSASASLTGSFFDATAADTGTYELTFTLDTTPPADCPESNSVLIQVNNAPNAGSGGSSTLCNENGSVNLSALLTGTDSGGNWTISNTGDTPPAGSFDAVSAVFDLINTEPGTYIFTYTLTSNSPCSNAETQVTINIVSCDCPSVELISPQTICHDESLDLTTLQITPEAGTWSISEAPAGSPANISAGVFNANTGAAGNYTLTFTLDVGPPANCPDNNSVILQVNAPADPGTLGQDLTYCETDEQVVNLFDLIDGETLGGTWEETSETSSGTGAFDAATATFTTTGQSAAVYSFTYTVENTDEVCPPGSISVNIGLDAQPTAVAGDDMIIDCNITEVTLSGINSQGENIDFTWQNEEGEVLGENSDISVDEAGDYILIVSSEDGICTSEDQVSVIADRDAPAIDAGEDIEADCNESSWTIEATGSQGNQFVYTWTTDNGEIENPDVLSPTVTDAGTYNLLITDELNGCTSSDQVVVSFSNGFTHIDIIAEGPPCFEEENGYIFIPNIDGGTQPFNYNLNNQDFGNNQQFTNLGAGSYELTLTDAKGCMWDTLIVFEEFKELELDLGENQIIDYGSSATVGVLNSIPDIDTIIWDYPDSFEVECLSSDCMNLTLTPEETLTLQATVIDENGCATTAFVTIVVRREDNIFIPNIFSPNDDGENDLLVVFTDENIASIKRFLVFNRWGETVHEYYNFLPNDPAHAWDGTHQNEPLNSQVLVWFAEVEFTDGRTEMLEGDITLIR